MGSHAHQTAWHAQQPLLAACHAAGGRMRVRKGPTGLAPQVYVGAMHGCAAQLAGLRSPVGWSATGSVASSTPHNSGTFLASAACSLPSAACDCISSTDSRCVIPAWRSHPLVGHRLQLQAWQQQLSHRCWKAPWQCGRRLHTSASAQQASRGVQAHCATSGPAIMQAHSCEQRLLPLCPVQHLTGCALVAARPLAACTPVAA